MYTVFADLQALLSMCRNPFSCPFLCDAVRSTQGWFFRESSPSEAWQRGIVSAEKYGWCQKQDTAFWQHHCSKSSCAPVPVQSCFLSEAYSFSLGSQKLIFPLKMKSCQIFHAYLISTTITDDCFHHKNDHCSLSLLKEYVDNSEPLTGTDNGFETSSAQQLGEYFYVKSLGYVFM